MIRFLTSSRNISTDVPWGRAGVPFVAEDAPAEDETDSDCWDWTSQSRGIVVAVGVGADANWRPVEEETLPTWVDDELLDLKEERRFWAEDLRRMLGRLPAVSGCTGMGAAMGMTGLQLKAAAILLGHRSLAQLDQSCEEQRSLHTRHTTL